MSALSQEVKAALRRIETKNSELIAELQDAPGYAVFPSVGRAGLVLGGAYGRGMVFEHGRHVGDATIGQVTLGVQLGGQTFSEIVVFCTPEALDRFKRGRIAFDANASAGFVKAAAGTINFEKSVIAKTYTQGGMMIEAALGVQWFRFKPQSKAEPQSEEKSDSKNAGRSADAERKAG